MHRELGLRCSTALLVRLGQSRMGVAGNHTKRQQHSYFRWRGIRRRRPLAFWSPRTFLQHRFEAAMDMPARARRSEAVDSMECCGTILLPFAAGVASRKTRGNFRV